MAAGNTCYLNSALQCLSHLFPLVKYFITDEWRQHVNLTSVDSSKGVFAQEFGELGNYTTRERVVVVVIGISAFDRIDLNSMCVCHLC